ncbi:MAG: LysR family transcriptional regulator [Parvularculaceae bacterium]
MQTTKLKHVVAVDQHESITAAAKSLNVTQSTVSRSLADIERDVGYALFDRRARDVVATERGRIFLNRAARIISDLDQLSEDARASREIGETLIRVGVSPASMQGLINKAVKRLIFRRGDLRIHLEAMSGGGGVRALRRGDIDVLIGPQDALKDDAAFAFERLGDLETHFFARKRHSLALKNTVKRNEIAAYPVVAPDQLSWHTEKLRSLFASMGGDSARKMHIVEYFPLVADIVAGSDVIGVISAEYSESKAFLRRFALLNIEFFEPLPVGLAVRKRWLPTPAVRAFQAALREFPPGL